MATTTSTASPLRLGIIGSGGIGAIHADAATRAGWTVAAFADAEPSRAERLAASHPGAVAHRDAAALLADSSLAAVSIATPNATHRPLAEQALAAGRHVLLEKPAGLDAAECDAIERIAASSRGILQIGLVCRSSPASRVARSLVEAGRLGSIYQARASLHRRRGIPGLGGWFTTRSMSGGGPLIDLGVHVIDLVMHVASPGRALRASGVTYAHFGRPAGDYRFHDMWGGPPRLGGPFDVEDHATALVRFEGGFSLEVNVVWASNLPEGALRDGIVLFGDRGGLSFEPLGREVTLATEEDGHLVDVKPITPPEEGGQAAWRRQYEGFAAAVRGEAPPLATIGECRRVQQVIDAIYRSAREGREVEV